jgi:hypothetical protein
MVDHVTHIQSHKEHEKENEYKTSKVHVIQPIAGHPHPNLG